MMLRESDNSGSIHARLQQDAGRSKNRKWEGRKFCDVHIVEKNIAQSGENLSVEK